MTNASKTKYDYSFYLSAKDLKVRRVSCRKHTLSDIGFVLDKVLEELKDSEEDSVEMKITFVRCKDE